MAGLRHLDGFNFLDRFVTERSAGTFDAGFKRLAIDALREHSQVAIAQKRIVCSGELQMSVHY